MKLLAQVRHVVWPAPRSRQSPVSDGTQGRDRDPVGPPPAPNALECGWLALPCLPGLGSSSAMAVGCRCERPAALIPSSWSRDGLQRGKTASWGLGRDFPAETRPRGPWPGKLTQLQASTSALELPQARPSHNCHGLCRGCRGLLLSGWSLGREDLKLSTACGSQ